MTLFPVYSKLAPVLPPGASASSAACLRAPAFTARRQVSVYGSSYAELYCSCLQQVLYRCYRRPKLLLSTKVVKYIPLPSPEP